MGSNVVWTERRPISCAAPDCLNIWPHGYRGGAFDQTFCSDRCFWRAKDLRQSGTALEDKRCHCGAIVGMRSAADRRQYRCRECRPQSGRTAHPTTIVQTGRSLAKKKRDEERYASQGGSAWPSIRRQVLARALPCGWCGEEIDYSLDGRLADGPHVDHIKPIALYPELGQDLNNLQAVHNRCNQLKARVEEARRAMTAVKILRRRRRMVAV